MLFSKMYPENIPNEIGYYLAGFADGEGSFNVSFRRRKDYASPWKISLCFNISQRDYEILNLYCIHLGCGTMRQRRDGVWYYEVNKFSDLVNRVIPFFKKFGFLSAKKQRDFQKFIELAGLIGNKDHLNEKGIGRILEIRGEMNDGGKRKYSDEIIRAAILESSETKRQTLVREMI